MIFTQLYGPEVKEMLLREINKNIVTEVEIYGPVEFSVFKHFPKVSLAIHDIHVSGSMPEKDSALFRADRIYLMMNLLDVIRQNWTIKTIAIENGALYLSRDKNGEVNYNLQGEQMDTLPASSFRLDIDKALLHDIDFKFTDELGGVFIDLHLDKATVRGNFSSEQLSLLTSVSVFSRSLVIKELDYAHQKQLDIDGGLQIDTKDDIYHLDISKLVTEKNHFKVNGNIKAQEQGPLFDLQITGEDISIKDFPKLLPDSIHYFIRDFEGSGNLQFKASIRGELSQNKSPEITASADVTEGEMRYGKLSNPIKKLAFKVAFTNGQKQSLQTSSLRIDEFKGTIGNSQISALLSLSNFNNPQVNLSIHGIIDLALFSPFLTSGKVKDIGGNVKANNFTFKGKIKDLMSGSLGPNAKFLGDIQFDHVKIILDSFMVKIPSGKIIANNSTASFDKVHVELPGTDFTFTGKVDNLTRLISGKSDAWVAPLKTNLSIRADHMDVRRLLYLFQSDAAPTTSSATNFNLEGNIDITSNYIQYDKFKAYDVSGTCVLNPGKIELKKFSLNTMDGMLDFHSMIKFQGNNFHSKTHVACKDIDISKLFYQMNNFGQDVLADKNLKGKLTTTLDINASFTNNEIDYNKLYVLADVTIKDGELISFKPLEQLSRFVDIEELRNVRFSTLKNQIHINERIIYIPRMLIQSNAMNLSLAGLHTMDHLIDYQIKLNIFDVLAKKIRKRKSSLSDYEVISEDNLNFFLSMTGHLDNPTIKYDKQGLKQRYQKDQENDRKQEYNTNHEVREWDVEDDLEYIEWD